MDLDRHLTGGLYYYDEQEADRVCAWVKHYCRHTIGKFAGQPFEFSDWQQERIVRPLYGIKRKDNGLRRYRKVYVEIPKKNGKTTKCSALCKYSLVAAGEPGAQVFSVAYDREQAKLCFNEVRRMLERSPADLRQVMVPYQNKIIVPGGWEGDVYHSECVYKPLSSEAGTVDGINASFLSIDELHRWKGRELYDALAYATSGRDEPITFIITTAGVWDPESIYMHVHDYATKVSTGVIDDPSMLVAVWAANEEEDDWTSEEVWHRVNPELGRAKSLEAMRDAFRVAKEDPSEQGNFKRLHLNIITNVTTRAIQPEDWAACGGPVNEAELYGRPCFAGLDLSTTTDITALALVFPPSSESEPFKILPYFWIPRERMKKLHDQDMVDYYSWVTNGFVEATEGNVIDYDYIVERIKDLMEKFNIQEVAFDPYNSTQVSLNLQELGLDMVEFRQGVLSMNEPTKEFLRLVLTRRIAHGDNPVLKWMASNLVTKSDASGNIKPDKSMSRQKIDGIVASIMGIGRAILNPDYGPGAYSQPGGLFL